MGAEAIVVQVKVLKGYVCGEESHDRGLGIKAKGVVVKVNSLEVREVENRSQERREGLWDLAQQTTGKDIGKVSDLAMLVVCCTVVQTGEDAHL